MTIALLQEKIDVAAGARLRQQIDERLDPIRQFAATIPPIVFQAKETVQTAQTVEVVATAAELLDVIAEAAYNERLPGARQRATREFLRKIEDMGVTP